MKHIAKICTLLFFFCSINSFAQTSCPNIEWMQYNVYTQVGYVDLSDNYYMTGYYTGSPTIGTTTLPAPSGSGTGGVFAKIDADGNALWVKYVNGQSKANVDYLDTDVDGNLYISVKYNGTITFNNTTYVSPYPLSALIERSSLLVKYDPSGQVLWVESYPDFYFSSLKRGTDGNFYGSITFINSIAIGNRSFSSNGLSDLIIVKLNGQRTLEWAHQIGGTGDEFDHYGLTLDNTNSVFFASHTTSPMLSLGTTVLNNPNARPARSELFITKINSSGQFIWHVKGGQQPEASITVGHLQLDAEGNCYVTGNFRGSYTLNGSLMNRPAYGMDIYVLKYDPLTQTFRQWVFKTADGPYVNSGSKLMYYDRDRILVAGSFNKHTDFGVDTATSRGLDAFLCSININEMQPEWVIKTSGEGDERAESLVKGTGNAIFLSGSYTEMGQLGNHTFNANPGGGQKLWLSKLHLLNSDLTLDGNTLIATQEFANYQWLDCDNSMLPIPGATGRAFAPAQNGKYAVSVSNEFCTVVSGCMPVDGVTAIGEQDIFNKVNYYPNPALNRLHIENIPAGTVVHITDIVGRTLYRTTHATSSLLLDVTDWVPGCYILTLQHETAVQISKILKQ